MSQKATFKTLEQRISALEYENFTLKQDLACIRDVSTLESIFKTAPIGLLVLINHKIVHVNKALCDITGYCFEDLANRDSDIFYPDEASYRKTLSQKSDPQVICGHKTIDTLWRTKTGRIIDTRLTYALIDEKDFTKGLIVTVQDITVRKKNEKEKALLLATIEQAPVSICITDPECIIEFVNGAFEQLCGYCRQELVGMDMRQLRSDKHDSQFYITLWSTISSGQAWQGHMINKRKDGSLYTVDATISSVRDENGYITNYVGVQRDISHQVKMNEKMAQVQKSEALGVLAGGIAHDLNNMLFPILGNTELLLLGGIARDNETRLCLEQIYESTLQAKALVHQVLTFSRRKEIEKAPTLIQNSIDSVLKLMKSSIPDNVSIKTQVDSSCPDVNANPTQIHQIIMNLLSNSVDAMGEANGVVKLSLMPVNVNGPGEHQGLNPGKYVCLSVWDSGAGMPGDVINQIFEPFYTTKGDGKGTGMGLAVVYGIVKEMEGYIRVNSRPGQGTEFNIYFPLPCDETPSSQPDGPGQKNKTGSEELIHVLFVDDEELILKVAKSMLDRLGCLATTMADPLVALDHFKKEPFAYDIVITDMHMPHMKGDSLAENIKAIRPDIPIFLCTGFSNESNEDLMAKTGARAVFSKPLSIREIADKIQEIFKPETQDLKTIG